MCTFARASRRVSPTSNSGAPRSLIASASTSSYNGSTQKCSSCHQLIDPMSSSRSLRTGSKTILKLKLSNLLILMLSWVKSLSTLMMMRGTEYSSKDCDTLLLCFFEQKKWTSFWDPWKHSSQVQHKAFMTFYSTFSLKIVIMLPRLRWSPVKNLHRSHPRKTCSNTWTLSRSLETHLWCKWSSMVSFWTAHANLPLPSRTRLKSGKRTRLTHNVVHSLTNKSVVYLSASTTQS